MKCINCKKGILQEKIIEHHEFGVALGKFTALVCNQCQEVFYNTETTKKIQEKSKEMGLFGLAKRTKVAQVGNSLAIRIPKEIAAFVGLKKEGEVILTPSGKKGITIEVR